MCSTHSFAQAYQTLLPQDHLLIDASDRINNRIYALTRLSNKLYVHEISVDNKLRLIISFDEPVIQATRYYPQRISALPNNKLAVYGIGVDTTTRWSSNNLKIDARLQLIDVATGVLDSTIIADFRDSLCYLIARIPSFYGREATQSIFWQNKLYFSIQNHMHDRSDSNRITNLVALGVYDISNQSFATHMLHVDGISNNIPSLTIHQLLQEDSSLYMYYTDISGNNPMAIRARLINDTQVVTIDTMTLRSLERKTTLITRSNDMIARNFSNSNPPANIVYTRHCTRPDCIDSQGGNWYYNLPDTFGHFDDVLTTSFMPAATNSHLLIANDFTTISNSVAVFSITDLKLNTIKNFEMWGNGIVGEYVAVPLTNDSFVVIANVYDKSIEQVRPQSTLITNQQGPVFTHVNNSARLKFTKNLLIHPNPANTSFQIKGYNASAITLIGAMGKSYELKHHDGMFLVADIPSGMYVIQSADGISLGKICIVK
jgi:hypothetical protein